MKRRQVLISSALLFLTTPLHAENSLLKLRDLYDKDRSFSDLAERRDGKNIELQGFMAPPLKAESQFFVLTKMPMSVCPFCETEAEWPDDIVVVYTGDIVNVVPFNYPISVSGELSLGTYRDEETGFVSRVRVVDATYDRL